MRRSISRAAALRAAALACVSLAFYCATDSSANTQPAEGTKTSTDGTTAASESTKSASARAVPDRFTATTTAMTPGNVQLRIDIRKWSDEEARANAVAALMSDDPTKALQSLPTAGYVWQNNSSVGYSVKYAHRAKTNEGQRITFVTEKKLGSYDLKPWEAGQPAKDLGYSVIELYLDDNGRGAGTLSLTAEVQIDSANNLVTLAGAAPRVLANAAEEPKPYWASGG